MPTLSYTVGSDVLGLCSGPSTLDNRHFLYDGHGSTRALADSAGAVSSTFSYDAYVVALGFSTSALQAPSSALLFSGEQFDLDLQQQYLRARYYDQSLGAFASLDPFAGNGPPWAGLRLRAPNGNVRANRPSPVLR